MRKFLFSDKWIRTKILDETGDEPEAGQPLFPDIGDSQGSERKNAISAIVPVSDDERPRLRIGLGAVIRALRVENGLTVSELAELASVAEGELREVETNPSYTARPRLLFQLAEYFGLSLEVLTQMSGATHAAEPGVISIASRYADSTVEVKYAARSGDLSEVADDDKILLDALVGAVTSRKKA